METPPPSSAPPPAAFPLRFKRVRAQDRALVALVVQMMQALAREEGQKAQLTVAGLSAQLRREAPDLRVWLAITARDPAAGEAGAGCVIGYPGFDVLSGVRGLHLCDLYVPPSFRRQGVARALLAHLAGACLAEGLGWMSWTVSETNASARCFYQSLGAQRVDVDFMALGVTSIQQLSRQISTL